MNFWTTIITAITAITGLVLSLVTWIDSNARPDMLITMPKVLGFSPGIYTQSFRMALQPTLTVTEESDMAAQVVDVSLHTTVPGGRQAEFYWLDNIAWEEQPDGITFSSQWVSGPAPFPITSDSSQTPVFRFETQKSLVTAGEWRATLTVHRLQQAPLVVRFCMDLRYPWLREAQAGVDHRTGWRWLRRDAALIATQDAIETQDCYEAMGV